MYGNTRSKFHPANSLFLSSTSSLLLSLLLLLRLLLATLPLVFVFKVGMPNDFLTTTHSSSSYATVVALSPSRISFGTSTSDNRVREATSALAFILARISIVKISSSGLEAVAVPSPPSPSSFSLFSSNPTSAFSSFTRTSPLRIAFLAAVLVGNLSGNKRMRTSVMRATVLASVSSIDINSLNISDRERVFEATVLYGELFVVVFALSSFVPKPLSPATTTTLPPPFFLVLITPPPGLRMWTKKVTKKAPLLFLLALRRGFCAAECEQRKPPPRA